MNQPSPTRLPGADEPSGGPVAGPDLLPAGSLEGLLPGLVAGFSTALPRLPDRELTPLVRALAGQRLRPPGGTLPAPVLLTQTHSAGVLDLTRDDAHSGPCDGMAAHRSRPALLAVKTADCVPLLAVDPETGGFAALHVGWRGAAGGILPNLLALWRERGSGLRETVLVLGPHIRACCYEVREDCLAHFSPALRALAVRRAGAATCLDLAAVLRAQAGEAGIPHERVEVLPYCTDCHRDGDGAPPFASYRRDGRNGAALAGTNVGLIGLLPAG
jgi:YfiH family protein